MSDVNEAEVVEANPESTKVRIIIALLTLVVFGAVSAAIFLIPSNPTYAGNAGHSMLLPTINAALNGLSGVLLVLGYFFIKRQDIRAHKSCMLSAFIVSALFLVTYLMHHAQAGSVPFTGQGYIRIIYFSFLIPHIILAAAVIPIALATIYRAWTYQFAAHAKIARITLPIWVFSSLSGVIVYWMLYWL
jgi:putative membrane protein